MELKTVPLNHIHERLGAKMVPFAALKPAGRAAVIESAARVTVAPAVSDVGVVALGSFSSCALEMTAEPSAATVSLSELGFAVCGAVAGKMDTASAVLPDVLFVTVTFTGFRPL